ncbi:MAG TPA: bifunctional phosphoglucose/phosphomannose isomerase [Dehalococcoidia bacterium]|nr:bifunctional phosphoglucose/phosphomannose isomerase [Dehalococcoidia bacterium]
MIDLDDPKVYTRLDPMEMRERIRELPQQCLQAWQKGLDLKLPTDYSNMQKLVILGMGGSAIGGDLLRHLYTEGKALIFIDREYDLPPLVDADTIVVASSYSGRTEETLSAFTQAMETPAKKLVLTTGGELKALAEHNDIPVYTIDYVAQPRAALAHSFFPLLGICQNLGIISDKSADVAEMGEVLENLQVTIDDTCATSHNPAKQLAAKLHNHMVIIYSAGILSPVAQRWKTQINENSKAWAFYEIFSELNHNAVVGYEFPPEMAEKAFIVLLRSQHLHRRILRRYEVTTEVLSQAKVSHETVDAIGESALSQMMSLILFGDWVSYYLALLYEVDPSPVKVIDYVKKRLSES